MSKPTDMDVLNELFTGECDLEPESDAEMDLRCGGPTFVESQARLARALDMLTVAAQGGQDGRS